MRNETFDYFWHQCFISTAESILNLYSEEVRQRFSWRCDCSDESKKKILELYGIYRTEIHTKYFYEKLGVESRIDAHKIGSCFAKAIIDAAPMKFAPLSGIPWLIKTSNYALAYYTSVSVVWFFTQAKYRFSNKQYYMTLKQQRYIQYPKTTRGHDSYSLGRIKAMTLRDIYKKDFDFLSHADMLFWIEHYNRQIIEGKLEV